MVNNGTKYDDLSAIYGVTVGKNDFIEIQKSQVMPLKAYDSCFMDTCVPEAENMVSGFLLENEGYGYLLLPAVVLAGIYEGNFFIEVVPLNGTEPVEGSVRFNSIMDFDEHGRPARIPDSLFEAEAFLLPMVQGFEQELRTGLLGFVAANFLEDYFGGDLGEGHDYARRLYEETLA